MSSGALCALCELLLWPNTGGVTLLEGLGVLRCGWTKDYGDLDTLITARPPYTRPLSTSSRDKYDPPGPPWHPDPLCPLAWAPQTTPTTIPRQVHVPNISLNTPSVNFLKPFTFCKELLNPISLLMVFALSTPGEKICLFIGFGGIFPSVWTCSSFKSLLSTYSNFKMLNFERRPTRGSVWYQTMWTRIHLQTGNISLQCLYSLYLYVQWP